MGRIKNAARAVVTTGQVVAATAVYLSGRVPDCETDIESAPSKGR
jgi:hypothetical protein